MLPVVSYASLAELRGRSLVPTDGDTATWAQIEVFRSRLFLGQSVLSKTLPERAHTDADFLL